jgi:integrase
MATKLLTDPKVKNASSAAEKLLADGDGLFCRVRPNGKDWLFIYSLNGKRHKQGLGPYPDVSLTAARQRATESRELVAKHINPAVSHKQQLAEQLATEAALKSRHTVTTLFEEWHRKEAGKRKDKGIEVRRTISKDVLPVLGDRYADSVKRRDIVKVLDDVKERGANRIANLILQYLRQMFRFAITREIVEIDPTYGLTKKDAGGEETERDRHLTEPELQELVSKLPEANLSIEAKSALWLMLSTCCRVGEISKAKWNDVDFDGRTWQIPVSNSKNKIRHIVHLSEFAHAQFKTLLEISAGMTWVIPSRDGKTHVCVKTFQKQYRDRQRTVRMKGRSKKLGVLALSGGDWTAHDLRRTGSTLMGELCVRSDVIDRCLNHKPPRKMERIYQRQELIPERIEAYHKLGERLCLLSRGEAPNVVIGKFGKVA